MGATSGTGIAYSAEHLRVWNWRSQRFFNF